MAGGEDQLTVLGFWASPFAMRVPIALEEKGVQYEYQEEDHLNNKSQLLLQMNPIHKKIPVLIHNAKPVCESLIIVQYIDETWPHQPLLPSHPYACSQARFWADFVDKKFLDSMRRILISKGEAQEEAKRDMVGCLDVLEGALGEGPYFGGQEFGFMDIAFIPFTIWFHALESIGDFKLPMDTQFPRLEAWIEKCMERESVKKALPAPDKVVDAKNLCKQLTEQRESGELPEAYLQIAFADVVLLNKVDLIVEEHGDVRNSGVVEDLKREIQNINSLAHIICSVRCQVDLNSILNCKAYDAKHVMHLESLLADSSLQPIGNHHDSKVKTICITEQGSVPLDQVNEWLGMLLWEGKDNMEVYRCKGVLNVHGSDEVHIIQAVRELYEIIPSRKWKEEENRLNKIVFIGKNLDSNDLSVSFSSCLAS